MVGGRGGWTRCRQVKPGRSVSDRDSGSNPLSSASPMRGLTYENADRGLDCTRSGSVAVRDHGAVGMVPGVGPQSQLTRR